MTAAKNIKVQNMKGTFLLVEFLPNDHDKHPHAAALSEKNGWAGTGLVRRENGSKNYMALIAKNMESAVVFGR